MTDQLEHCRCRRCLTERGELHVGSVTGYDLTMTQPGGKFFGMIVCETCGNKRCPHATDHRNECTYSNEPSQPPSMFVGLQEKARLIKTVGSPMTPVEPPKDGTPIFAIGEMVCEKDMAGRLERFTKVIRWDKELSGWVSGDDGLLLSNFSCDHVVIAWFIPMQKAAEGSS